MSRLAPGTGGGGDTTSYVIRGTQWTLVSGDGTHPSTWRVDELTDDSPHEYTTGAGGNWFPTGSLSYSPVNTGEMDFDVGLAYFVLLGPEAAAPEPIDVDSVVSQTDVRSLPDSAARWVLDRLPDHVVDADLADVRAELEESDREQCGPNEAWDPVRETCRTVTQPTPPPEEPPEEEPPNCGPNSVYDPTIDACRTLPGTQPPEEEPEPTCPDGQEWDPSVGTCVPIDEDSGESPGEEPPSSSKPMLPAWLDLGFSIGPLSGPQTTVVLAAATLLLVSAAGGN
jgi:hypothetical protein